MNEPMSIRDSLEETIEKVEPTTVVKDEPVVTKDEPAAVVKDEPVVAKDEPVVAKDEPVVAKTEPEAKYRAPAAWKAGAKERWATLPPDVQEEVARRERETAVAIQQNAEGRRFAENFHKAIEPYRSVMAAEGATDPIQTVQNLMQTVAGLRMGTPVQKADIVARIINVYGVDIGTLDSILSGNNDPKVQQQSEIDRILQERLAPYEQYMRQQAEQQTQYQQQQESRAAQAVDQFASQNEFVDDPEIANSMADLLEMSARRGRQMTMQAAYDQAVRLHPEISKIVEQRAAARSSTVIEQAKLASSSVKGSPMGGGPASTPTDIRSAIVAAMERQ